jgi:competence protein ComEA
LDSAVVKRLLKSSFLSEHFSPRRINVNTATERDLSIHPYLPVSAAKAIVSYRFQHGDLTSVEDLRKIPILDEKTIQKITPYLEFRN